MSLTVSSTLTIMALISRSINTADEKEPNQIKKAIKYNRKTYKRLRELILSVKNDEYYSNEYSRNLWVKACEQYLDFFENGNIVSFLAVYSNHNTDGIITNVAHVTKTPTSPIIKHLVDELNESYLKIKNLKESLEEL